MVDEIPKDFESLFKKSTLPVFRIDCSYVKSKNKFVPNDNLDELDPKDKKTAKKVQFIIQESPSRMAKCRICGVPIGKGEFRLGFPIRDCRGDFGTLSGWSHLKCCGSLLNASLKQACDNNNNNNNSHISFKENNLQEFKCDLSLSCINKIFSDSIEGWDALEKEQQKDLIALSLNDLQKNSYEEAEKILLEKNEESEKKQTMEPPSDFIAPLLLFQKEGLYWMCEQENKRDVLGGILADEMGMGKTIQTIALLLSKISTKKHERKPGQGGSLIVAPLAAVLQWKEEIAKFTKPNSLGVLLYYGHCRAALIDQIKDYDVVIVTYSTLESDYRKVLNLHKLPCKYCGRMFLPEKLNFHLRYFCGSQATRTERQAKTEKKRINATKKAMETLNIINENDTYQPPTVTNVYRSILKEAQEDIMVESNRVVPWLKRHKNVQKGNFSQSFSKEDTKEGHEKISSQTYTKSDVSIQDNSIKECIVESLNDEDTANFVKKESIYKENTESFSEDPILERAQELRSKLGFSETEIRKKKVSELKSILKNIGEPSFGTKVELTHRLLYLLFPKSSDQNNIEQNPWDLLQSTDNMLKKKPKPKLNDLSNRRISIRLKTKISTAKKKKVENFTTSDNTYSESYLSSEDCSDTVSSLSSTESLVSESSIPQKKRKNCLPIKQKKKTQKKISITDDSNGELEDEYSIDIDLSPLHVVTWERIVLDEAHRIKGRTTSSAKAVYALKCSGSRWCLTGTPLQNRVGELYSLIRFLRLNPCAYYFCKTKGCECVSLHYRFKNNRFCVQCNHARMAHYSWFNRNIITPIKKYGCQSEGREALKILKQEVLNKILLRRTKLERADDVKLPPLTVLIRRDKLIPSEQDFYDSLYKKTATQYDTYVKQGTTLHNFAHIFDLLSRLRQAVDHPYLILFGSMQNVSSLEEGSEKTNPVCWLCHELFEGDVEWCQTRCHHTFHKECLDQYINSNPASETSKLGCPKCFSLLTVDSLVSLDTTCARSIQSKYSSILNRINLEEFNSSTKIEALVQELESINESDATAKTIVFSQYAAMLDLIEFRLKKGSITCAKLVGSMSLQSRCNVLQAFTTNASLRVLLMSLKAGGEGLNLQIANNIFLMEPWWNPATEMQAIQRAHRIGQTKPVRAVRFICENTVEEKMLQLQEKKQLVFDGTIGAQNAAITKLTHEDLNFLFQN